MTMTSEALRDLEAVAHDPEISEAVTALLRHPTEILHDGGAGAPVDCGGCRTAARPGRHTHTGHTCGKSPVDRRYHVTATATEEQARTYEASGYDVAPLTDAEARIVDLRSQVATLAHERDLARRGELELISSLGAADREIVSLRAEIARIRAALVDVVDFATHTVPGAGIASRVLAILTANTPTSNGEG